jgi:DNA gyrase/topoisomerase IV subunit A
MAPKKKVSVAITKDCNIVDQKIGHFVRSSMYRYGSKVIEDRAIPEYRDGLKPAARRVLYSMYELGALPDKSFKKSARVTGDAAGKYHPHGSAYSTLVNLAFLRYPLVVPQGSFGNEFDPPAAERYTEVRLAPITDALFSCLGVTQMVPNYSDEFREPLVFSSRLPLLLLNGSDGVAVGLRNNIPSHNLKEVIDALVYVTKAGEKATLRGVLKHIQGPDHRTGGILLSDADEVAAFYASGSGKLRYQCDYVTEPDEFDPKITNIRITGWPDGWRLTYFVETTIPALTEAKMIRSFDLIYDEEAGTIKEIRVGVDNAPALAAVVKNLKCSVSFNLNITTRNGVDDISFKRTDLLSFLVSWSIWRQGEESKVLSQRASHLESQKTTEDARLLAMRNIDKIVKVLTSPNDPVAELCSALGCSKEAAKFILDLRIKELRKADVTAQLARIAKIESDINSVASDLRDLPSVVIRELQSLRKYQDERRTKVRTEITSPIAIIAQGDTTAFGVTRDGKVFGDIQPTRTTASSDMFVVGSFTGITLVDASGLALNVSRTEASGVQGKTFRNIVGVSSQDYPFIVAVTCDGSVVKVPSSTRGADFPLSKSPLIRADSAQDSSNLIIWGPKGQVDILPVSSIPENKRNGRGTKLVKYKPVAALVYHSGTRVVASDGTKLTKETLRGSKASDVFLVGSRNLVAYESGRRAFLSSSAAVEALSSGGISQIWSVDAPKT